jgi:hypothetical protein
MLLKQSLFTAIIFTFFIVKISAQDSLRVQDPQPVVITQDGYDQQVNQQDVPLNEQTFKQRLKYGGSFGPFQFSNFQSIIGLSPIVGYKLTEQTIVGAGASLIFWRTKIYDPITNTNYKDKTDLIGYSAFLRQDLPFTQKLGFPLHITVEATQFQGIQQNSGFKPALLAGLGMGNAGGYGLQVLWDFNYKYGSSFSGSFNNSPLVIRVTGFFN